MRRLTRTIVVFAAIGALFSAAAPAAADRLEPNVANGQPAPDGAYPYAAKLTLNGIPKPDGTKYNSACSGALIRQQWVLTAGHCFHDANKVRISGPPIYDLSTATVGRTELTQTRGHVVDIIDVRQSPSNDIALAKLATPVTDITPIGLRTSAPQVGAVLRIAGWGATSATGQPVNHLQTGQFKISSVTATTVLVKGYLPNANTSACAYDSGAPYFYEGVVPTIVGVESTGPNCPHNQAETTARVDTVVSWINQQTGG